MATGRIPTTANSPLTAKGDLFTFSTGSAKLAVGNNGETLVADSSQTTGLAYIPLNSAGKNAIINGGMDIWQRGTSFVPTGSASYYTADRFVGYRTVAGSTITRQVTNDTTNLPNIQYCMRVARNSGNTSTNLIMAMTPLESTTAIPFAGKTVTVSWYARAGANFSAASSNLSYEIVTGTGTDQNPLTGYTGQVAVSGTKTLTTTWQRFSYTQLIPTTATEIAVDWYFTPVGTAGANDYFEITGVQLELGTTATVFSRAGGTIQGELAACQRYYYRITPSVTNGAFSVGNNYSTTINTSVIYPKVTLRTTPTLETSGTAGNYRINTAGSGFTCSSVPVIDQTSTDIIALNATVASGLTVGNAGILIAISGATSILAFSAEL